MRLVNTCGANKCELICNSNADYVLQEGTTTAICRPKGTTDPTLGSCQGSVPANADYCQEDTDGLTGTLTISLVGACTTIKCEVACNPTYSLIGSACVPTGTITGNVRDANGPVAGATVTIAGVSATTDAQGNFRIENVPVGAWDLVITSPNHDSVTIPDVNVRRGETITLPESTLAIIPPPAEGQTGTVAGKVKDADGYLQSVRVSIAGISIETDSNGAYTISNVPVGRYDLTATALRHDSKTLADVEVSAGATTSIPDITLDIIPIDQLPTFWITITDVTAASPNVVIKDGDVYKTKADSVTITGTYSKEAGDQIDIVEQGNPSNKATLAPDQTNTQTAGTFTIAVATTTAEKKIDAVDKTNPALKYTASAKILKDLQGPTITLYQPASGFVASQPFDLVIETDEPSKNCKAVFRPRQNVEPLPAQALVEVENTNKKRHKLAALNNLQEYWQIGFTITCDDLLDNPSSSQTVSVTIDKNAPVITNFGLSFGTLRSSVAAQNLKRFLITEKYPGTNAIRTRLTASTDEVAKCKYSTSESENYESMQASNAMNYEPSVGGNFDENTGFKREHASAYIEFNEGDKITYYISCIDRVGSEVQRKAAIEIDANTQPTVRILNKKLNNIECSEGCTTNNQTPIINFQTDDAASCKIDGDFPSDILDLEENMKSSPDKRSHAYPRLMTDPGASGNWTGALAFGSHEFDIKCKDESGASKADGIEKFTFTINPDAVEERQEFIEMVEPNRYGVSANYVFDIKIKTLEAAICKWYFDKPFAFEDMNDFSFSGNTEFLIDEFDGIKQGDKSIHKLYVSCNQDTQRKEFDLSVDQDPPVIEEFYAYPTTVADTDRITRISVKTNEPTICRYGKTQNPNDMQSIEGSFATLHTQNIEIEDQKGEQTYYAVCHDRVNLQSVPKEVKITYNPDLEFEMIKRVSAFYGPNDVPFFSIETNKKAGCLYKREGQSDSELRPLSTNAPTEFYAHTASFSGTQSLAHGYYKFNVFCTPKTKEGGQEKSVDVEFFVDLTPPTMDYTNDTSALEREPEFSCYTDQLRVKWLGNDAESGISLYEYSILKRGTSVIVKNWTNDELSRHDNAGKWQFVRGLKLENRTAYNFLVRANNSVNVQSQALASDGVTVDSSKCDYLRTCTPGTSGCPVNQCRLRGECEQGIACDEDVDCRGGYCNITSRMCGSPSCSDGVKNGRETDKDCGANCGKCDLEKGCITNEDCTSGNCEFGVCKEVNTCRNGIRDGSEVDKDCGGACRPCGVGNSCSASIDCGLGLECVENKCAEATSPEFLDNDKCPDEWEIRNGLDPTNANDCNENSDADLLSNFEEFQRGTNPLLADSDGDGYFDDVEVEAGTDPLDPNSFPTSRFGVVMMLIFGILLLLGGTGFLLYRKYGMEGIENIMAKLPFKRFRKAPGTGFKAERGAPKAYPKFAPKPEGKGPSRFLEKAKKEERKMEQVFKEFGAKTEEAKEKPAARKIAEKKEIVKEDVFARLSKVKEKPKKEDVFSKLKQMKKPEAKEEPKQKKEDVFARLSELKGKPKAKGSAMEELRKISKSKASAKK